MEAIYLLFSEANVLPTVLMLMVVGYWLLMITGVVGMDEFDIDVDVDVDVDIDLDIDGDLIDAAGADIDTGGSSAGGDSALKPLFEFLYMSDVPIVIAGSAFVFGYWISSIAFNYFFNPSNSFEASLIWVIPNVIVALLVTRVIVIPAAAIGRKTAPEDTSRSNLVDTVGTVTSSKVNETFGQLMVKPDNEPEISLNVRTLNGQNLSKGDAAKILSYNNQDGTFLVELAKWENNTDD